jgi:hypothetical protein
MLSTMKIFLIGTLGFSSLLLPIQATAETVRGIHRELSEDPVNLGTASNYAILAETGISTVPNSMVTGHIAVSPYSAAAITGFNPLTLNALGTFSTSSQFTGVATAANYGDAVPTILKVAVEDMEAAYTDAASRPNAVGARLNLGAGKLGGVLLPGGPTDQLTSGVYTFGTDVYLKGDIHFDGGGDSNAIFIIQISGSLFQSGGYQVILENNAQARNIFWQVEGLVNVGTTAHMEGILLVKNGVTFMTGSSLDGRIFAQTACVLQMATINSAAVALA